MLKERLASVAVGCLVVLGLSAACGSDSNDDAEPAQGGTAGKTAGSSGSSSKAGSGSGGKGGAASAAGGDAGGEAGAPSPDSAGAGGEGGVEAASCSTVRAQLLGPIDAISSGLVEDISEPAATSVTLKVDASAGGFMAAANNPYIYVKLAAKNRTELTDLAADASADWDIALKRDNLRSNSGDSGPGAAEVAILEGADFDGVTSGAASTADFAADAFIDAASCQPITDSIGKPVTRFDGWYEYGTNMKLSPANRVYLVRDAHAATVYKLQIIGYYVEVPDGLGGTVSKSAVYTLRYAAL